MVIAMADYGLFNTRVNAYGDTGRERIVNTAKEDIAKNLYDHPNLRDVKIDGKYGKLVVISKDRTGNSLKDVKQILSLPSEIFNVGQYVEFSDETWLIHQADVDNEMYVDGKMTLCPNILKFQDSTGKIHSYPYFVDTSLPSLDENKTIVTSSTTRKIKLPFDELTKEFFIDKRFMGEVFGGKPQCWIVEDLDSESSRGLLIMTLEKDVFNNNADNIELGICDYFDDIPPVDPIEPDSTVSITYTGKSELRAGGSYKDFSANYSDENGEEVFDVDSTWIVEVNPLFEQNITYQIDGNKIKIKAENVSGIIGQIVKLIVIGDNDATTQTNIVVVPLF